MSVGGETQFFAAEGGVTQYYFARRKNFARFVTARVYLEYFSFCDCLAEYFVYEVGAERINGVVKGSFARNVAEMPYGVVFIRRVERVEHGFEIYGNSLVRRFTYKILRIIGV